MLSGLCTAGEGDRNANSGILGTQQSDGGGPCHNVKNSCCFVQSAQRAAYLDDEYASSSCREWFTMLVPKGTAVLSAR